MKIQNEILSGDCLLRMAALPADSIDTIITDPPYGYNFMGKKWDIDVPSVDIFKAMFRVLKPGAFAFIMSAPRQDVSCKMMNHIQDAGFDISFDPIEWVYASGFPKAQNIGKGIDNRLLYHWVLSHPARKAFLESLSEEIKRYITLKKTETDPVHQEEAKILIKIIRQRRSEYIKAFRRKWAREAYGIILENKKYEHWGRKHRSYQTQATIFSQTRAKDQIKASRKRTFAGDHAGEWDDAQIENEDLLTAWEPISPEAKAIAGMYAASPKPARELVFVVQKPGTEPSNLDQAIQYQNGGLYYDRGRIPADPAELLKNGKKGFATPVDSGIYGWNSQGKIKIPISRSPIQSQGNEKQDGWNDPDYPQMMEVDLRGRFPANLLISDNVLDIGEKTSTSCKKPHVNLNAQLDRENNDVFNTSKNCGEFTNPLVFGCDFSDKFSLDQWWFAQIPRLPKHLQRTFPFLHCPKPSKSEKNQGLITFENKKHSEEINSTCDNPFLRAETERKNIHPTVKPIALFSYLIAISPTKIGDMVLDPFLGSGTTLIACHLTGRRGIGIELDARYVKIAQARLKHMQKQKNLLSFAKIENKEVEMEEIPLDNPGTDVQDSEIMDEEMDENDWDEAQEAELSHQEAKDQENNSPLGHMWQGR